MAQEFVHGVMFDRVIYKRPELLTKIGNIVGKNEFKNVDDLNNSVINFLHNKVNQGTIAGDLWYMLNTFSDNPTDTLPEILLAPNLCDQIYENKNMIRRNIEKRCI